MSLVSATGSFTPCSKNAPTREQQSTGLTRRQLALATLGLAFGAGAAPASGTDLPIGDVLGSVPAVSEITSFSARRGEDGGIDLQVAMRLGLPSAVQDALLKGIPIVLVAEFELFRYRWYWRDDRVARGQRPHRLSYQPLSRRWRVVSGSAGGAAGVGSGLTQNFDTLADALGAISRVPRWRLLEAPDVDLDSRYTVDFRFRLDRAQLPRPFQLGAVGLADWDVNLTRAARVQLTP
jgi:hypothetical protein